MAISETLGVQWRVGEAIVQVDEHVDEQEHQKGERVCDQDIRNDVHAGAIEESHLLFSCTLEEEAGGVQEL